jgi:hypothetical protein
MAFIRIYIYIYIKSIGRKAHLLKMVGHLSSLLQLSARSQTTYLSIKCSLVSKYSIPLWGIQTTKNCSQQWITPPMHSSFCYFSTRIWFSGKPIVVVVHWLTAVVNLLVSPFHAIAHWLAQISSPQWIYSSTTCVFHFPKEMIRHLFS